MRDFYKNLIKKIDNVVNLNLSRKHYCSIMYSSKIVNSSIKYSSIIVNSSNRYSHFIIINRFYELYIRKKFNKRFLIYL